MLYSAVIMLLQNIGLHIHPECICGDYSNKMLACVYTKCVYVRATLKTLSRSVNPAYTHRLYKRANFCCIALTYIRGVYAGQYFTV